MAKRSDWFKSLAIGLCGLLLGGCATTKLASTWRDPGFTRVPLKKMAIIVVAKDQNIRRFAEDQATRSVPPGTTAVASYTLFDQPEADIATVKAKLTSEGFDSVLVTRLVMTDKSKVYMPPQTHMVPMGPSLPMLAPYGNFYGYYPYAWSYTYTTPGYETEVTRIIIETLVYELPEGKPVWTGVSESVNPDSPLDLVNQLVEVLRAQLQKEGLLVASPAR